MNTASAQTHRAIGVAIFSLTIIGIIAFTIIIVKSIKPEPEVRTYALKLPLGCAPPTEPGDELHLRVKVNIKGVPSTECTAKRSKL